MSRKLTVRTSKPILKSIQSITYICPRELDPVTRGGRGQRVVGAGLRDGPVELDGSGVDLGADRRNVADNEGGVPGIGWVRGYRRGNPERHGVTHAVLVRGFVVCRADALLDGDFGLLIEDRKSVV